MTSSPLQFHPMVASSTAPRRVGWRRRVVGGATLMAVVVGASYAAVELAKLRLQHPGFVTGYTLFGMVLFLAAYHFRKRFPAVPLMSSANWLQLHVATGWCAVGAFFLHTGWRFPDGRFEQFLAALFLGTAASGVYGLLISRIVPRRLAGLRVEAIYERIPEMRTAYLREAETLALAGTSETTVLAQTYEQEIAPFLASARQPFYYLFPTGRMRRRLVAQLRDLHRYLSPERRGECQRIELLVCQKDDLDYHVAMQGRLKIWLFAHIGLTYSLIAAAAWHGVLAHAFHGGLR